MDKLILEMTRRNDVKSIKYKQTKLSVTKQKSLKDCLKELGKIYGYKEIMEAMKGEVIQTKPTFSSKRRVASVSLAGTALAILLTSSGCHSSENIEGNEPSTIIEKSIETPKTINEDYENMSVDQLIALLPQEIRDSWKSIDEFQDYFNNTAAPTIKISEDNGAQLYLKSKEIAAYYILANNHNLTTEELANIFKGSGLESKEPYSSLMVQMSKVLWTYYAYATESSGISMLYEDKTDKEIVEKAESYILKYNKTKDEQVIEDLNAWLNDLFFGGHIDKITETNPGATSYIGNILLPLCKENGWISETALAEYERLNENTTCDYFLNNRYQDIKKLIESSSFDYKLLATDVNGEVLDYLKDSLEEEKRLSSIKRALFDQMNEENIKASSRDIAIEAREVKELGYTIEGNVIYAETETISEEVVSSVPNQEITREEAVEQFGQEAVHKAEQDADKQFHEEYDEYNKQEQNKVQDITAAYNFVYNLAYNNAASGKTLPEITSIVNQELQAQGINTSGMNVSDWISVGYEDGRVEWEAYNKNNGVIKEEITEEYIPNLEPVESSPNTESSVPNDVQGSDDFGLPEEESSLPSIPNDEYFEESFAADTFELPEDSISILEDSAAYEEIEEKILTEEELSSSRSR